MKKTVLFSILLISLSSAYAQLNQKSQRIRYFSDHTNPSAWDGGKSYAYYGGGASITNFGNAIPVESINGIQALKIQSTKPSGYWNVIFKISVHSVNYERMGSSPYLYLRLKWTDIANGADLKVELQSYANNKYLDGNNTNETSSVLLSNYISPSNNWQDVYIPISDFQSNNPNLNINRVAFIRLLGEG